MVAAIGRFGKPAYEEAACDGGDEVVSYIPDGIRPQKLEIAVGGITLDASLAAADRRSTASTTPLALRFKGTNPCELWLSVA